MAYIAMAYIAMTYRAMTYIAVVYVLMAYVAMAYVMACSQYLMLIDMAKTHLPAARVAARLTSTRRRNDNQTRQPTQPSPGVAVSDGCLC